MSGVLRAAWRLLRLVGVFVGAAFGFIACLVVLLFIVIALGLGAVDVVDRMHTAVDSPATECKTKPSGPRARGKLPQGRVVLTPLSKDVFWAFDASRSAVAVPIQIMASPPLTGIAPAAIEIIPSPLIRSDSHVRLPNDVTYTALRVSRNGELIMFDACLDPRDVKAGRYSGSIFVYTGLPNVIGTSVDFTVTARSPGWFGLGLVVMFAAIIGVLTLKGVSDYSRSLERKADGSRGEFSKWAALRYIWMWEDLRLVSSLVGVLTAIIVGLRVYNTDRTWGDDAYQDSVALAAAAIAAIGAQGILDGFVGARTRR